MDFLAVTIDRLMKSKIFNIVMANAVLLFISYKIYSINSSIKDSEVKYYYKNIKVKHPNLLNQSDKYIKVKEYIVKKGDSMLNILLLDLNIKRSDYVDIISSIKKFYDPNKLKIGQIIKIKFLQKDDKNIVQELIIDPYKNKSFLIKRDHKGNYISSKIKEDIEQHIVKYSGRIDSKKGDNGIFDSMIRIGIPIEIINQFISMYSFDIDFGRDIQDNTKFEVIFERYYNQNNVPVEIGNILYSSIQLGSRGRSYIFYSYKRKNRTEFFDIKGRSIRKSLLKTPINGARISSRFGMRRHPILGYSKMHKGIDFAAPRGTPIFASGSGIIRYAGWKGAYGKYVRIKHNSQYQTAYAHLSKIPSKIKNGKRVTQGDIIGYVGSTGRSTGPHLHYEILRNGKQINPAKVKSTPGVKLTKNILNKFKKNSVDRLNKIRSKVPNLNESI